MKRAFDVEMEIQNLLVEINGSRFAHNVSLSEVNFHVVRAMFTTSTQQITENTVLSRISKLFKYFYPVLKNYIKGPNEMRDCLRALEVCILNINNNKLQKITYISVAVVI